MQVVEHVLQYLKVNIGKKFLFKRGVSLTMKTYTGVYHACSMNDKRSTLRLLCLLVWQPSCLEEYETKCICSWLNAKAEFRAMTRSLWIIMDETSVKRFEDAI